MRRRRLSLGLLLPAGLVVLLALFASLQYQWLGQVSEAERDQLRRSLEQRAADFADDVDRELSRAYLAFQIGEATIDPSRPETLAPRLASWRAVARFPDIIGTIYVADAIESGYRLLRYELNPGTLEAVDWPAGFDTVRARLTPQVSNTTTEGGVAARRIVAISTSPLVLDVPALVIPLAGGMPLPEGPVGGMRILERRATDVLAAIELDRDFIIVELDRAHLRDVVLPALADRHFGDDAGRYRVSIVDDAGLPLLSRGVPENAPLTETSADAARRFLRVRLELERGPAGAGTFFWQTETTDRREPGGGTVTRRRVPADGEISIVVGRAGGDGTVDPTGFRASAWQLLVQHSAGSLDAAVAQARTRNLWLSFGILSVLAVSVGLIVLNARRSERLAAQQMDFVATVSHELRTPLAVIRSAAQNLSAGVVHEAGQAKRYGDLIETEGRRLTQMVEHVLEFAGLSGNRGLARTSPIDPGALVRDVATASADRCREQGVEISTDVAADLPLIEADEDAVRRALDNLIANALKYGADGRWIGVTARRAAAGRGAEVQIAVSDRGRGIPAEDLGHIFEPFYRGRHAHDRQIQGNGLGLSLVRRIAEAHGGRVTVKSGEGHGTTFTLHLPGVEPDRSIQPIGQPAADAGPRG